MNDLNFYWRMGDYALQAVPKCLARFDKHFTIKVMLNGYHGICENRGQFTVFKANCDQWEKRETEQHDQS